MIYITRRERFNAAHRMFKPDLSDEENFKIFGPCSNPNWHGHNYILHVTVSGELNPETGFIMNLKELSSIIKEKVIDKLDHKNINIEVDFMKGKIATSENLVVAIWDQLEIPVLSAGALLHKVKLEETENNFVEYFGKFNCTNNND